MKLKVIAHTSAASWTWKVIVELDRDTVGVLTNTFGPDLPQVGAEIDISDHVHNMKAVNAKFAKLTEFSRLLNSLTEKPQEQTEEKGNN